MDKKPVMKKSSSYRGRIISDATVIEAALGLARAKGRLEKKTWILLAVVGWLRSKQVAYRVGNPFCARAT